MRGERVTTFSNIISNQLSDIYEKRLMHQIERQPVPEHVAIIMDGNRRFATARGFSPFIGHKLGRDTLEEVMGWCLEVGIKVLTVYAFSTENLNRAPPEVRRLMELFERNFRELGDDERVHRHEIRVQIIGQIELLPGSVQSAIRYAETRTAGYDNYFYNIAVAYGGRQEIVQAIQSIARDVQYGRLEADEIDEELVSSYLYTRELPDPDLVLRTSGEERISNFLLWQLAYSEFYFTDVYWPGFKKTDFLRAIRAYQERKRRFGE